MRRKVNDCLARVFWRLPARLNIGIMIFMGCFLIYLLRVNMSISILAMVEPQNGEKLPSYGERFPWDMAQQGLLLGADFWGYMITAIPGAYLAERIGAKIVIELAFFINALITILCPLAAHHGFRSIYGARIVVGFLVGPLFPCFHNLISRWIPPDEKGKYMACLQGGTAGTIFTWQMIGFLVEAVGWPWGGFYIPAIIALFGIILWIFLVFDSPDRHPRITPEEKHYIESSLGDSLSNKRKVPPYLRVIKSGPFWALLVLHYGSLWGLFFLLAATPKFLSEILNFQIGMTGVYSSLPHAARLIFSFIFGIIGDAVRRRNLLTITQMRKFFCIFSHILPGLCFVGLCFVRGPYTCIALLTVAMAFSGASVLTNMQNCQDLAPNFAASIYGILNTVATTSGIISPLVLSYFTQDNNTFENWIYVFLIGSAIYIGSALVYVLLGSGEIQPWNTIEPDDEDERRM
ncbi:sialin-like [Phlebotomus argentipes]|uniref:sialin-like n=1 Tax=Phlebotomus argentipes TaxID=94469 RepID=UPI0028932FD3|nr:sialin-like [Phlebotomus argentipes]